jgi:hypothetical protein
MKKFLFLAIVSVAFFASCTADDVDTTTKLNNSDELERPMPIKDKTRD